MKILRLFRSPMSVGRNSAKKAIKEFDKACFAPEFYEALIKREEADVAEALTSKEGLTIERHDFSVGYLNTLKKALARKKK